MRDPSGNSAISRRDTGRVTRRATLSRPAGLALCAFVAWLGSAAPHVRAQGADAAAAAWPPIVDPVAPSSNLSLAAEVGLTTRSDVGSELWVVSPLLAARYRWSQRVTFGIDWGFVYATESSIRGPAQDGFALGNPMLRASYDLIQSETDRLGVHIRLVPPVAWLPRDVAQRGLVRGSFASAAATRGLWDAWLWGPEQVAWTAGARWVRLVSSFARVGAEGDVGVSLPLSPTTSSIAALFVQVAPFLELFLRAFTFGARVQGVAMTASSDALQLSVAGYVRLQVHDGWSLQLLGLLNVDEPLGFMGAGLGIPGLLVSLRGNL